MRMIPPWGIIISHVRRGFLTLMIIMMLAGAGIAVESGRVIRRAPLTATAVATPTIDRTLSRLQSPIILSSLQGLRSMKACLRVRQSAFVRKMRVVHGFTLMGGLPLSLGVALAAPVIPQVAFLHSFQDPKQP